MIQYLCTPGDYQQTLGCLPPLPNSESSGPRMQGSTLSPVGTSSVCTSQASGFGKDLTPNEEPNLCLSFPALSLREDMGVSNLEFLVTHWFPNCFSRQSPRASSLPLREVDSGRDSPFNRWGNGGHVPFLRPHCLCQLMGMSERGSGVMVPLSSPGPQTFPTRSVELGFKCLPPCACSMLTRCLKCSSL